MPRSRCGPGRERSSTRRACLAPMVISQDQPVEGVRTLDRSLREWIARTFRSAQRALKRGEGDFPRLQAPCDITPAASRAGRRALEPAAE